MPQCYSHYCLSGYTQETRVINGSRRALKDSLLLVSTHTDVFLSVCSGACGVSCSLLEQNSRNRPISIRNPKILALLVQPALTHPGSTQHSCARGVGFPAASLFLPSIHTCGEFLSQEFAHKVSQRQSNQNCWEEFSTNKVHQWNHVSPHWSSSCVFVAFAGCKECVLPIVQRAGGGAEEKCSAGVGE